MFVHLVVNIRLPLITPLIVNTLHTFGYESMSKKIRNFRYCDVYYQQTTGLVSDIWTFGEIGVTLDTVHCVQIVG